MEAKQKKNENKKVIGTIFSANHPKNYKTSFVLRQEELMCKCRRADYSSLWNRRRPMKTKTVRNDKDTHN